MFNQLSGINAILYYLNDIFALAGFNKVSSDLQAVAIGATNQVFTILAMLFIDRGGRRALLTIGAVGTAASLGGVAAIFATGKHEDLLVWLLIGFIASFAFSQGAVIWVYLSEVFPTAVRSRGQSLGSSTHWIMNALISWAFPIAAASSRSAPFVFFAAMMMLQLIVVGVFYPETKCVSLENMEERLIDGKRHTPGPTDPKAWVSALGRSRLSAQGPGSDRVSMRNLRLSGAALATTQPQCRAPASTNCIA